MIRVYGSVLVAVLCMVGVAFGATKTWNFDDIAVGATPAGWKSESINKTGLLATFEVVADATAPGAAADNKVLTVKFAPETVYEDCHAIWNKEISFTDGTIEVDSKAIASDGYFGGIAFRIKDKDNYYAIRCGIRRSDIQLFKVTNGTRTTIGYATTTAFSVNTWYHINIVVNGTNITVSVDGTQLLTTTDDSITGSGGVGLFQRANKIAFWDNFSVND